jgi:hypothetical protein
VMMWVCFPDFRSFSTISSRKFKLFSSVMIAYKAVKVNGFWN